MGFFEKHLGDFGKAMEDRVAVVERLRYCSDGELKEYLRSGTPIEREAARSILQSRA
jgi:hypothetical protein